MSLILVLSPHLDDAVLSCEGMMVQAVSAGRWVVVYDLFCEPYRGGLLSPVARELQESWGNPEDITELRIEEDKRAMDLIGVERILGDQRDLIYRQNEKEEWLYPQMADITGERNKTDDVLVAYYTGKISELYSANEIRIIAPLGIGGHIDHLIAFDIGVELHSLGYPVAFYEDLPYAMKDEWRESRHGELRCVESSVERFSMESLEKKIEVMKFYVSQIPSLFENEANMRNWLTRWAKRMSGREDMGGEIVWRFTNRG